MTVLSLKSKEAHLLNIAILHCYRRLRQLGIEPLSNQIRYQFLHVA